MMTSNEIRKAFLDYFESKGHHVVPSAPMVIKNDPTLMFTNAGMNQFKDIFLGNQQRQWPRATDSQKCLRVSGKHNDLEEVGHDTYHHTMFEMLGNWSFGDYFKKEAIAYGWEFLTEVMKINKDWLYVTVFGGDEKEGLGMDTEAYDFWKAHISEDRILKGSKKDNFWEMGDQGPCGPCSEIHVDIRPDEEKAKVPGKDLVNKDNPQVIEIWNLVFMQYNRKADGTLEPLKAKHIDTGMGFERLCMVMQGKRSNYDTDVFQPLIQELAHKAGKTYGQNEDADIAMRVCADHLRAVPHPAPRRPLRLHFPRLHRAVPQHPRPHPRGPNGPPVPRTQETAGTHTAHHTGGRAGFPAHPRRRHQALRRLCCQMQQQGG